MTPTSRRFAAVCLDMSAPTKSEATKSDQASLSDIGGTWIDALSLYDLCLNGSRVTIFPEQNCHGLCHVVSSDKAVVY